MKPTFTSFLAAGALLVTLQAGAQTPTQSRLTSVLQKTSMSKSGTERLVNQHSRPGNSQNFANDFTGGWTHYSNSTYTYDSQGRLTQRLDVVPVTNQNIYKFTYTYDAQGNETQAYSFTWDGGAWKMNSNSLKTTYTYTTSGKPLEVATERWDDLANAFVNDWRTVSTYNSNGFLLTEIYYLGSGNTWEPMGRNTFSFTSPTAPPTSILFEEYVGGAYVNGFRYTNIIWHNYALMQPLSYIAEAWGGGLWNLDERVTITYDSFGGFVETYETYNSGTWELSSRWTESYDSHFNFTGTKNETWTGSWMTDYEVQEVLTYNANHDITQRVFRNTFNINGTLEDDRKEVYSNFVYINAAPANQPEIAVSLFPNPASDYIIISSGLTGNARLTVTDLAGKALLTQQVNAASGKMYVGHLSAGTYLLQLKHAEGSKTAKIIKL